MQENQHSFVIPDNQNFSTLVAQMQNSFSVHANTETVYNRVFYDTFDWRLYKNGSVLEVHDDGLSRRIYWRAEKSGKLRIQLGLKKVPHLAADLPACGFRQQLLSVTSVRELFPHIKIRVKRQSLSVLDQNKKVVVRINFDVFWYSTSRLRAAKVLSRQLTIKAVKGYREDYLRVKTYFLDMQWQAALDNAMKLAMIESGVSASEYTTKLSLRLDPDMPDIQAFEEVQLRLLEIIQQNTTGSIHGRDTEFIHDYHDSINKAYVALKQVNGSLPKETSSRFIKFFDNLIQLTEPLRNIDVFLLQLESYHEDFNKLNWQQLQPLRDYLLLSRAEMHKAFSEELKSSRYRETIKQWRDYLKHNGERESLPPENTGKVVCKLADELLWGLNNQTIAQGKAVVKNSNAETLRDLGVTFERQCYLIEFFRSLYPAVKMRVLIQAITDVQSSLVKFNNLHIQISYVEEFIKQCTDKNAIKAGQQLIEILKQQQSEASKSFKDSNKSYSSAGTRKKFKELFVEYYEGEN